ncbi:MAG: ABC transporter substrate-binding protein [Candidatus Bathyarchaeota archaeon]|nr:ABC transporter substrate-binding protein [Candidatus Bathyarchaeota archaeon]
MKGNTLAIVLLVVGLVVGGGVGYFAAPTGAGEPGETVTVTVEKAPLEGVKVQLGYISSTTVGLETTVPLVNEILTVDYNEYAAMLGYDVEFEYLIDDATGQAAVHLEKVQSYKAIDISVFIGGGWSSQASGALSYCNDNDMLMWSSSSTSPLLAIPDDNLLRMCPTDLVQAPAISRMLSSHGIKAVICIYRGDAWADGIMNYFEPAFTGEGGVIIEKIRYAGEATEFANYLQTAENLMEDAVAEYGADACAVEIISFAEFVVMMTQAADFPLLYSLPWFGSDGTTLSQQAIDDAPEMAMHLKVYSTYAAPAESEKFLALYDRYFDLVSQPFGFYSACSYDIGWILTTTILEAQSSDAMDIISLQEPTAFNQFGASGWNRLNLDGDRYASNYQIWGYGDHERGPGSYVYGLYDGVTDTVTWNTGMMGYTPVARVIG